MINIPKKTLESLEFPLILQQVSSYCITELGKEKTLAIYPYSEIEKIQPELHRVKEFTASFNSDSPIPNHGFDSINKELHLLAIENSTLEVSGFRKILSITDSTQVLLKFFKKFEEFYISLNSFSEKISYTIIFQKKLLEE